MEDSISSSSDEENIKRKKIRRILLLKTDEELKRKSKKNNNIMINSKTFKEMDNSHNIYNILLSEKSIIYSNYVKTEEKIIPNIHTNNNQSIIPSLINKVRTIIKNKKMEKPIKLLNSTFEEDSISPVISSFPKKIDLGFKRFSNNKKSVNVVNIHFIEDKLKSEKERINEDKLNKSTRVEKRGIYRLIDKIVNLKMNENTEDLIKDNIIKLRKYCNKLKKKKKKIKKLNKLKTKSCPKKSKEFSKRKSYRKRMTITNNKSFFKKSLFGSKEIKIDLKRVETRVNTAKQLNIKNIEIEEVQNKKEKEKEIHKFIDLLEKERKVNRNSSTKIIKKNIPIKKDKIINFSNKKKGLRKMQTLNFNNKKMLMEFSKNKVKKLVKNSEINKNDETVPYINLIPKEHLMSSKIQRPSKFLFNNNNNNNNIIIRENSKKKINSLFDVTRMSSSKEKKGIVLSCFNNKDKDKDKEKERLRTSIKKNKKSLHIKKEDKHDFSRLEKKYTIVKDDLIKCNIFSENNRKQPKKKINKATS